MLRYTSRLFTTSPHSSNTLLQHDRKLCIMHSLPFVFWLRVFFFLSYYLSENACHVDLKEPEFVRRHFLSLWGPVLVDVAVKVPRDRKTSVYLFVDCRTPLFSC